MPTYLDRADYQYYTTHKHDLVGGFNHLEKYEFLNGKDYPIYYGKWKMFETTNQMIYDNIL